MHTTPNGKKRVLLLVTKSNMGGAQKYVLDMALSLPQDQFEVSVAAGGNGTLFEKCVEHGIQTLSLPYLERDFSMFKEIRAFFTLLRLFRKEKPDIVHLNSPKMGGLGGLAARIARVKRIIYTNHGWTFNEDRPLWQKILIKMLSWFIVLLSHCTIVLSRTEKDSVRTWPFIEKKLYVIALGIHPPIFLDKAIAREKLFDLAKIQDDRQEVLLSIGELTKNKGYTYAIDALKHCTHDNFLYFIIGAGELKEHLQQKVKELGLETRVFLLGFVQNAAEYMKAADLLILPSVKEGMPYVLLEAGFAHVPVISSDVGGIREITTNENSLFPPKDASALRLAIQSKKTTYIKECELRNMVAHTLEHYK